MVWTRLGFKKNMEYHKINMKRKKALRPLSLEKSLCSTKTRRYSPFTLSWKGSFSIFFQVECSENTFWAISGPWSINTSFWGDCSVGNPFWSTHSRQGKAVISVSAKPQRGLVLLLSFFVSESWKTKSMRSFS